MNICFLLSDWFGLRYITHYVVDHQPNKMGTELIKLDQFNLDTETKQNLFVKFNDMVEQAKAWEAKAMSIVVTDETQVKEMEQAKEGRIILQKVRTGAEKLKKELKAGALNYGRAIDFLYNFIEDTCKPLEAHLLKQEKFKEVREKEKKDELQRVRAEQLAPYVENPAVFDLANMPEDTFQMVLAGSIKSLQDKKNAEKQAEIDRLAKIEEDNRIKAENERLRQENQAKEAAMKKFQSDQEAEAIQLREKQEAVLRKFKEEEARKKAESDKLLKEAKEREAKLAKELKDKQEAEEKAKADAEKRRKADERKSRLAPDKDKLVLLAQQITDLKMPEVKSEEAKKVVGDIVIMINKLVKFINEKIPNL